MVEKVTFKENKENKEIKRTEIKLFSYTFMQVVLLVLYYGFNIIMPLWVVWFPTITFILGLVLTLLFIIFLLIMSYLN